MLGNLKEQFQEVQNEIKKKLEQQEISGEAGDGKVKVVVNGNRKLLSIDLDDEYYSRAKKGELQTFITEALNDALDKAEEVAEEEMKNSVKGILPGIF